ncbi:hypothetical protein Scep_029129 [Stephania cephalantha]|uniref:Uncharacterized protein n=1 Tax=Stephania cephalantha TaxID=152367 RepID=A0AAP0E4R3_9MAGN
MPTFNEVKLLRVLDLEGLAEICKFPKEIGNLIHLRYLGMRHINLIGPIPCNIGNLQKLQTLDLSKGYASMPDVLWRMEELRILCLPSVIRKQKQLRMDNLRNLHTLKGVEVGSWMKKNTSTFTNVVKLFVKARSMAELSEVVAFVDGLTSLQCLSIRCSFYDGKEIFSTVPLQFGGINCQQLVKLKLYGYFSYNFNIALPNPCEFPPNLTILKLQRIVLEEDPMPTLEKLPNLTHLCLCGSYNGTSMVCKAQGFPRLQKLELLALFNLEEWIVEEGAAPHLHHLTIRSCGKLMEVPEAFRFVPIIDKTCQNRKDGLLLRLLLTCLQNGITEPWQRIPSVVAIFSAEASFVLLDPSNDHYAAISKLLMHSQQVNMKSMPLFNTMFESTSVNFKKERLWILQLSYAGLNLDVDAHIFMKGGLLEILMSFYYSPVADYESKILILQVVNVVISSRTIIEWLQTYSLEQLSEFSSHALKLFADNSKMIRHDVPLVISLLKVLVSTLRISQKRKLYQPHFTLSHEGLFQLCQAVDTDVRSSLGAELGLRAMLMSTPPAVFFRPEGSAMTSKRMKTRANAGKFRDDFFLPKPPSYRALGHDHNGVVESSFNCTNARDQVFQIPTGSYYTSVSEEDQSQDSLISKLLRWVTASVILEKVLESFKTFFSPEIKNARTLRALLENVDSRHMQSSVNDYAESRSTNEALASIILYLQQLLVVESRVLSSVVSALSLLLLSYAPSEDTDFIAELCSKIRSPVEINSAWRWSYYKPWEDLTSTQTELEKIEERHACQTLTELMLKKEGAGLIVVVSLWRVVRVVESAFEVSDEAIEAKIEKIVSQFEVLSSENQLLRESIVEKDKLILELEAALDLQAGCGAGKCNIEIVGQPL